MRSERAVVCLLVLLFGATATRGIQLPMVYAVGQWLHNFDFGFVKRGLPGELLQPLLQHKSNAETFQIIVLISVVVFALLGAVLIRAATRVARDEHGDGSLWIRVACAAVFVTSPFVVTSAHLIGYFDHWIALATFGLIALVTRREWLAAGLLGAAFVFVHELILIAGIPVVIFASWLRLQLDENLTRRSLGRFALQFGAPIGLAAVIIIGSSLLQDANAVESLQNQMRESKSIPARWVTMTTYHLSHGFSENLSSQSIEGWNRLTDGSVIRCVAAPALFLLIAGFFILQGSGHKRNIPLFAAAALSPLALHWVAWDTARISTLVILQAFTGIYAMGELGLRFQSSVSRPAVLGFSLAGLATLVANVVIPVPLLEGQVDGRGLFAVRSEPLTERYACHKKLFPNSDLEDNTFIGWEAKGEAFREQPVSTDPRGSQRFIGNQGLYWISSAYGFDSNSTQRTIGGSAQGIARSQSFRISGDEIVYLVGGEKDSERLYVALIVNEKEVHRATGPGVDAMAPVRFEVTEWMGESAYFLIADLSELPTGYLNADGFCYSR